MAATDSTAALVARLRAEQTRLENILLAPNTQRGYAFDYRAFAAFCNMLGLAPLPASSDTVGLYAAEQLSAGRKVSTVARRMAAIAHAHRAHGLTSPVTEDVRNLLRGARRDRTRIEEIQQACPLAIDELRAIAGSLLAEDTPMALRDRAILVVGVASALRSANLAALMMADVEFAEQGAKLKIHRSKTDQYGRGAIIGLLHGKHPETDPVACLREWMNRRGSFAGPVFTRFDHPKRRDEPLQPERICQIVQKAVARIGLAGAFSSHSLRASFVTAAVDANVSELNIMGTTGHKDRRSLASYFRRRDVLGAANPLVLIDL
jgi:site-specific recombinase XerD